MIECVKVEIGEVLLFSPLLTCGSSLLRLLDSAVDDLEMTEVNSSLIIEQVFPPRGLVGPSEGMQNVARLLRSNA